MSCFQLGLATSIIFFSFDAEEHGNIETSHLTCMARNLPRSFSFNPTFLCRQLWTLPNFSTSLLAINTTKPAASLFHNTYKLYQFPPSLSLVLVRGLVVIMRSVGKTLIGLILVAALLGNGGLVATEARPLNAMASAAIAEDFFEGLSLGAIKQSGPSPGGDGHKFVNFDTLGGIKESGPSPGDGHSHITSSRPWRENGRWRSAQVPAKCRSNKQHNYTYLYI